MNHETRQNMQYGSWKMKLSKTLNKAHEKKRLSISSDYDYMTIHSRDYDYMTIHPHETFIERKW